VSVPAEVTARAPGKVNLALSVGALRADGYHELVNVFHAVSLTDDVTARPATGVRVSVEGLHADRVPVDATNLAARAAALLAERTGVDDGVHLHIRKQIPVAAGMAGGSADAAAALLACDALWSTGLSSTDLLELAAELGSDVPFALTGGTAVGTGRGERLTPVLARGDYEWVFAVSDAGLSTPAVYAELDRLRSGRPVPAAPKPLEPPEAMLAALRSGDPAALGAALFNDLEAAACLLAPRLLRTLDAGREAGALGALICGSGPSVAFLVADPGAALDLAAGLTAAGVADDVRRARGPVPGARLR
jgi:4-diphosphocytidyl-2-C-methyl-D-erythritol kinase